MDKLYLRDDFEILWRGTDPFRAVAAIGGDAEKAQRALRTILLQETRCVAPSRNAPLSDILFLAVLALT